MSPALRIRYALEWGLLKSAALTLRFLPWKVLRALAWVLGSLACVVDRRGRRDSLENLRAVLGGQIAPADLKRLRLKSYRTFSRTFLELFWAQNIRREKFDRFFSVHFTSDAARLAFNKGGIFCTLHFSNFEWLSLGTGLQGQSCLIIAENFKNNSLTPIFRKLREAGGHKIIAQEGAALKFLRHLKRGGSTAALVDLNVSPEQSGAALPWLGLTMCATITHAALAIRLGLPLLPALAIPQADGRYLLTYFEPILPAVGETPEALAQRCLEALEPTVRARPECWMWMYKHWRYLPHEDDRAAYPAYANYSKKFAKLLRKK